MQAGFYWFRLATTGAWTVVSVSVDDDGEVSNVMFFGDDADFSYRTAYSLGTFGSRIPFPGE